MSLYKIAIFICLVLCITGGVNPVSFSQTEANFENNLVGIWQGKLEFSGMSIRVVFNISKGAENQLTATMDSPDQGAKDIPVEEVTFKEGVLRLEVKSVGGFFEGRIKEDFLSIQGEINQAGQSFPLVLERVEEIAKIYRPQEPKKPYPYFEEEVTYENKGAEITLAGTLTLPGKDGPFPTVLLISGSGAQDRDETILNHRPFLILADYLTRLEIAVLRVDDRGVGGSTGGSLQDTSEDFAGDVLAGIEYLKSRKEINSKKIGLVGHSEGAIIGPMVAAETTDVAFCVMLGGTGLTGEEVIYSQAAMLARANGASDELVSKSRLLQENLFDVLKEEENNLVAEKKMREMMMETIAGMSEKEKQIIGLSEDNIVSQLQLMLSPWYRHFLFYDPKTALTKVQCPILAIVGEKDLQVAPKENLLAIEDALKVGGNKDYQIIEIPGLNHLLQTAETGAPSEYGQIEETISPKVLNLVGEWILERTGEK